MHQIDPKSIEASLVALGLAETDAIIYMFLNTHGESDVPTLMNRLKLSRTSIYNTITTLSHHQLITQRKEGKNAYYAITDPNNLLVLLEEKNRKDLQLNQNFKQTIASLSNSFRLATHQPGIHVFNGKEGIIRVYNELLDDRLPIDSIEDKGEMEQFIPEYIPLFIRQRIVHRIQNRVIIPTSNQINTPTLAELREVHALPTEQFPFGMDIKINAKKVVMTTFQKQTAVGMVIIHPEIVKNYQILFNWMWSSTMPQ